jgi:hypothetical protein
METIGQRMGSDSLLFVPVGSCGYWRQRDRCKFCHYDFDTARARKIDPGYRVALDFQGMYEMVKEALKETGRWRRIMITGGSDPTNNYQDEFDANCRIVDAIARAVRESSPGRQAAPPIYLIATPMDEGRLKVYKEAGVAAFGIYLETWNPEHFKLVCPGKHKYQGREFFLEQALKAVDIFGEGNAIAGFVAGVEMAQPPYGFGDMERALESTLSGYEYLIKNRTSGWIAADCSSSGSTGRGGFRRTPWRTSSRRSGPIVIGRDFCWTTKEVSMAALSAEIIEALGDPTTARVLTTTRRDGTPHAVFADWLIAPDPNTLAYLEPFELSRTSANLLHHLWEERRVSIALFNADRRVRCEISGTPSRVVSEGPLWDQLLGKAWNEIPDANPSGLWLITPEEVTDQSYPAALTEMEERRENFALWWSYLGKREPGR